MVSRSCQCKAACDILFLLGLTRGSFRIYNTANIFPLNLPNSKDNLVIEPLPMSCPLVPKRMVRFNVVTIIKSPWGLVPVLFLDILCPLNDG